ncbi:YeeE/YedE thiosulfate transporter family protein [Clostridium amazonitimonense]|uniref:YeeE/YedE thiosulfate transporter family protein n=1 Tax=Clostridium amazonitimonense TaxID=1499689 RepID=UPI0005AAF48C|nr:YeeE/YedE thiosulfate transporter family protein [Clostridium amazonitimonense]
MTEMKTSMRSSVPRKPKKKKVNQIPFGVALFLGIIGVGFFLGNNNPRAALMWGFGVSAGFTLQRSRFCFTASLRDPVLTGGTSLTKAVIIAIAVASVGFISIQYGASVKGGPIPGNISPVGVHIAIGAIMFGVGAVIAGGCASGTLMRVGEGFLMQMLAFVFFIIGSLWGAKDFGWWAKKFMPEKGVFLPDVLGWAPAIAIQFAVLLALYILADWFGNRKSKEI